MWVTNVASIDAYAAEAMGLQAVVRSKLANLGFVRKADLGSLRGDCPLSSDPTIETNLVKLWLFKADYSQPNKSLGIDRRTQLVS